ncbi:TPA: mechanosensitive ion channel family protein [Candidatus Bipolaricaulota bacterium]|nr:mechanosensitive ion channel family protein [Candidatus Bipolaricaulota bacterium]HIQ00444.1 mechanosensitive ion channel family protein [Candidatus Bipolaricaulota bacterium]
MSFLHYTFLGNQVWQYGAFFLILLGAGIAHWALRRLWGMILSRRPLGEERVQAALLSLSRRPLGVVLFLLALWGGLQVFTLPAGAIAFLRGMFLAVTTFLVVYALSKLTDVLFAYWAARAKRTATKLDDQVIPILSKVTKAFLWGVAVLLVLQNLGYNVSSLLAGLGIGGLAIALAAQETLSNFIGTLALLVDRPCEVGDRVQFEDVDGTVEAVGLRSTRIRTLDGTVVSVPNRLMANAKINNIAKRPTIKNMYTVGIVYDTPYEKLQEALRILREVLAGHPSTDNYWVYFKEFGPYSLNILVIHWCKYTAYQKFLEATEEINLEIKRRFEEAGIEFAFPTQTIQVQGLPPLGKS